ncbi:MAG TPA: TIGR03564 family F420-dependent LLM class oxidoreductase [Acidimicrobiales bacterium]|nr:TIGR03564 family F420-dependent LLM class oxidoreductase [Acidimicrobiales bacterium]
MRIGLSGGGTTTDRLVQQAVEAEADGFRSLWYPSAILGDPLVALALAGRATTSIELGTAVLQTYTCHPVLQANRAASTAAAMGRPGLTIGVGPSHEPVIEGMFGLSYADVGAHTEEYVTVLGSLVRGEGVSFDGEHFRVHIPVTSTLPQPVSVMVSALAPRMLRVAGELTDGTILWMGNAKAIETHVGPRINAAAKGAGRSAPRIVAGLPVAVHDDVAEARAVAAKSFANYGVLANYRRLLDIGGAAGPGDAAIVGDEASVAAEIRALFDAGATDVWAAPFPVGDDRSASRHRTRALLKELAAA